MNSFNLNFQIRSLIVSKDGLIATCNDGRVRYWKMTILGISSIPNKEIYGHANSMICQDHIILIPTSNIIHVWDNKLDYITNFESPQKEDIELIYLPKIKKEDTHFFTISNRSVYVWSSIKGK